MDTRTWCSEAIQIRTINRSGFQGGRPGKRQSGTRFALLATSGFHLTESPFFQARVILADTFGILP